MAEELLAGGAEVAAADVARHAARRGEVVAASGQRVERVGGPQARGGDGAADHSERSVRHSAAMSSPMAATPTQWAARWSAAYP